MHIHETTSGPKCKSCKIKETKEYLLSLDSANRGQMMGIFLPVKTNTCGRRPLGDKIQPILKKTTHGEISTVNLHLDRELALVPR